MKTKLTTLRRLRFKSGDFHAAKSVELIGEPFFVIERNGEIIIYSKICDENVEFNDYDNDDDDNS